MLSLYIHIPFCLKRCTYCDFVSGIYEPEKAYFYIKALKKELSNIPDKAPFSTLYIGGGTPTALSSDALSDFINYIFDIFKFVDKYEATIEANPGTLDSTKLKAIRSSGINRISIGVQSFNNDELSFLGRIHTSEEAEHSVTMAKEAGFDNIGIDLIYGVPGQTNDKWLRTLEIASSLRPQHISTYELTIEEGTALHDLLHSKSHTPSSRLIIPPHSPLDKGGIIDEELTVQMYNSTIDYLLSEGFMHYEISNFALPDYACRHNLNYWDRGKYYGAGLGAHSFIKDKRFYNTDSLDKYLRLISENRSAVKDSEEISADKALSEAIFLGMRKTEGINVESFSRRYGRNIMSGFQTEIMELQDAGLIESVSSDCSYETNLKLTRKGLMLSNEVFQRFI